MPHGRVEMLQQYLGSAITYLAVVAIFTAIFSFYVSFPYNLFLGLACGHIAGLLAWLRQNKQAENAMTRFQGVQAVGPLAEALHFDWNPSVQETAANSLIHLLPRLQATDAHLLNEHQRKCLYRALERSENAALILAILQALKQIGDHKALSQVEKLVAGKGKASGNEQVKEAAEVCLSFLKERMRQEVNKQTLLRSADTSEVSTDTLLRPARGESEIDPQQLLRSSAPDESDRHRNHHA